MNMLAAAELNMYSQKVQTRNRANTIQVWSWKLVFRIALTVVRFLGKALQKLVVKNDLSIKSNSRYVRYWNQTLMAEAGGCELAKIQSRVVHLKATLLCGTTLKLGATSRLAWLKLSKLVSVGVYWAHVYRGPSRGPCIGIIYIHPSRVGGIHPLFPPTWYH